MTGSSTVPVIDRQVAASGSTSAKPSAPEAQLLIDWPAEAPRGDADKVPNEQCRSDGRHGEDLERAPRGEPVEKEAERALLRQRQRVDELCQQQRLYQERDDDAAQHEEDSEVPIARRTVPRWLASACSILKTETSTCTVWRSGSSGPSAIPPALSYENETTGSTEPPAISRAVDGAAGADDECERAQLHLQAIVRVLVRRAEDVLRELLAARSAWPRATPKARCSFASSCSPPLPTSTARFSAPYPISPYY
jgi:hypothetical protein